MPSYGESALSSQNGEGAKDALALAHTSMVLKLFVEGLRERPEPRLLDIGPVCGENIDYLARQVYKHYVCDMFLRLDRSRRKGQPPGRVWQQLDYPAGHFDGILLWDLPDHLDDNEVSRLVKLCHRMIRPKGQVVLFALGDHGVMPQVHSIIIGQDYQITPRVQDHLDLPLYIRQNREVLALMAPFNPVKSVIFRDGLREFLFQLD